MAFSARIEGLTTTAEEITTSTFLSRASVNNPVTIAVENVDPAIIVYIGGSDVVTAGTAGWRLDPGDVFSADIYNPTDHLYAVSASGTPNVRIIQRGA